MCKTQTPTSSATSGNNNKGLIDDHSVTRITKSESSGFHFLEFHSGSVLGTVFFLLFLVVVVVAFCACYRCFRRWSRTNQELRGYRTSRVAPQQPQGYPSGYPGGRPSGALSWSGQGFPNADPSSWISQLPAGHYEVTDTGLIRQHRPALHPGPHPSGRRGRRGAGLLDDDESAV